ncbi:DinB family protein [Thermosporothrix hazakensis]|uniref:DinB family protein n=2 Tax=Thermosporothrix TaxID=768650 RepID=A0A326UCB2_THEHA|nr:DinB family protein [Thermosporothrix hazakensis]
MKSPGTLALQREPAFFPEILLADLERLQNDLIDFFATITPRSWVHRPSKEGWTLFDALVHVSTAAELYLEALEKALTGEPLSEGNVELPVPVQSDVDGAQVTMPQLLLHSFLSALQRTAAIIPHLRAEEFLQSAPLHFAGRFPVVAELLALQIIHPALLHTALLSKAIGAKPLWNEYPSDYLQRNILRLFAIMPVVYRRELFPDVQGGVNWHIGGPAGGHWFLLFDEQARVGKGSLAHPALSLWFPGAHAFLLYITAQISMRRALATGKMMVWGNLRTAAGIRGLLPKLCLI